MFYAEQMAPEFCLQNKYRMVHVFIVRTYCLHNRSSRCLFPGRQSGCCRSGDFVEIRVKVRPSDKTTQESRTPESGLADLCYRKTTMYKKFFPDRFSLE